MFFKIQNVQNLPTHILNKFKKKIETVLGNKRKIIICYTMIYKSDKRIKPKI